MICGKTSSVLPSEGRTVLRGAKAASSGSQTFCATKPYGGGFIEEKNAAWSD
jgi:hypothetical protein